ncbi:unnamed protein product [Dibothriocephalus latus]|uniref:Phorbol-ester/DAG-type domain-containing protein n=1 Tax=Dibothriocephalus latus TaxID=60516 RepID=A0A3P7L588_DIBLA|nr:unnamed protein product [Dibothriocephalus latus]
MAAYHIVKGTPAEFALPAKKGGKAHYNSASRGNRTAFFCIKDIAAETVDDNFENNVEQCRRPMTPTECVPEISISLSITFKVAERAFNTVKRKEPWKVAKNSVVQKVRLDGQFPYEFILPIAGDREEVALSFFAKSEEARSSWMRAAITVLDNLFPPGARDNGYHFEMNTFKQTTYCYICRKLLQGCFYQGYRCRETGIAAHKACLQKVSQCLPPRYPAVIPPAPPLPPPVVNCSTRGRGGPPFRQINGNSPLGGNPRHSIHGLPTAKHLIALSLLL